MIQPPPKTPFVKLARKPQAFNPMDVISSLRVRDDTFSVVEGLLAWLAHTLDSFACSSPEHSAILSYRTLMDNPVSALSQPGVFYGCMCLGIR